MIKLRLNNDPLAIGPLNDTAPTLQGSATRQDSVCWALTGVVGGTGVTSLCIQIAYELTQRQKHQTSSTRDRHETSVCILDLDFENGSCSHYLDLEPGMQISDLQGDSSRIDRTIIEAMAVTHKSGISLLTTPNSLKGNSEVNPASVLALMDVACQMFDYVIFDVPRVWQPWTHAAMAAADNLGFVTELTIPALHKCRMRVAALKAEIQTHAPMDIILNKYERIAFRNSLRLGDAEATLGQEVFAKIGLDSDVVREAINWGIPVGTKGNDSRFAKDSRALLDQWMRRRGGLQTAMNS